MTFNTYPFGIYRFICFKIIKCTAGAPGPGTQRTPVIWLSGLAFIYQANNTLGKSGAVIGLPTVILAFLYGQSRIFLVMARDGFFPKSLATIWRKRGTPARITSATAVVVAIIAAVTPIDVIASLANAGTLCAFVAVAVCVLVRRRREPDDYSAASFCSFRNAR